MYNTLSQWILLKIRINERSSRLAENGLFSFRRKIILTSFELAKISNSILTS